MKSRWICQVSLGHYAVVDFWSHGNRDSNRERYMQQKGGVISMEHSQEAAQCETTGILWKVLEEKGLLRKFTRQGTFDVEVHLQH